MIAEAGHYALVLALGLALIQSTVPILGAQWRDPALMMARSTALAQLVFSLASLGRWLHVPRPRPISRSSTCSRIRIR